MHSERRSRILLTLKEVTAIDLTRCDLECDNMALQKTRIRGKRKSGQGARYLCFIEEFDRDTDRGRKLAHIEYL